MDYNAIMTTATALMTMAGFIALIVSVLTEFWIKKLFTLTTQHLNAAVSIMSIIFTVVFGAIYAQNSPLMTNWCYWAGMVLMGFFTACIAMSGYDKVLSYIYEYINNLLKEV